jgi:hypothetical protein
MNAMLDLEGRMSASRILATLIISAMKRWDCVKPLQRFPRRESSLHKRVNSK